MKKHKQRCKIFWKNLFKSILILICFFLFFLGNLKKIQAQEEQYHWIEKVGNGYIDWTTYCVSASTNGTLLRETPLLMKSKKLEVMNNLFEMFYNLPIEKGLFLGKIWNENTKKFLWGEINNDANFSFINTSQNSTIITLTMPISSSFLQQAIPLSLYLRLQNTHPISPWVGNSTVNDFVKGFTGIIIQVSTPKFSPSLFIYLYTQNKNLLYGPASMSYNTFLHTHMALFLSKEDKATISKRVGNKPLILSAQDILENNVHALILDENNSFYFKFKGIMSFLAQGKVIIMKKNPISINTGVEEFNLSN